MKLCKINCGRYATIGEYCVKCYKLNKKLKIEKQINDKISQRLIETKTRLREEIKELENKLDKLQKAIKDYNEFIREDGSYNWYMKCRNKDCGGEFLYNPGKTVFLCDACRRNAYSRYFERLSVLSDDTKPVLSTKSIAGRYGQAKTHAESKGCKWDLTLDQYEVLVGPDKCYYCERIGYLPKASIALDRKDSAIKEYTVDNCVPCCNRCNTLKTSMAFEGHKEYIQHRLLTGTYHHLSLSKKQALAVTTTNLIAEFYGHEPITYSKKLVEYVRDKLSKTFGSVSSGIDQICDLTKKNVKNTLKVFLYPHKNKKYVPSEIHIRMVLETVQLAISLKDSHKNGSC